MARRPGERHAGWWFVDGFPQHGPRLVASAELTDRTIQHHLDGWLVHPCGHDAADDHVIERWNRRDMPSESELRRLHSVSVPLRDFPDGWESSAEYLTRHSLLP